MKIIKQGQLPADKVWHGTCFNCKTVAQATGAELRMHSDQRGGTWGTAACPLCDHSMSFYEKNNNQRQAALGRTAVANEQEEMNGGACLEGVSYYDKLVNNRAAYMILGDVDKPFHRPECECQRCEAWREQQGRPTHKHLNSLGK